MKMKKKHGWVRVLINQFLIWLQITAVPMTTLVRCAARENDAEIGQPTKIVPSVAMILPEGGSKDHYHNILMVNVRLWKRSVSDDSADDDNVWEWKRSPGIKPMDASYPYPTDKLRNNPYSYG